MKELFDSVRGYKKAAVRFAKAVPDIETSRKVFDASLERLVSTLCQPNIKDALDAEIEENRDKIDKMGDLAEFISGLRGTDEMEFEKSLASQFGFSKNQVEVIVSYFNSIREKIRIGDVEGIVANLKETHVEFVDRIEGVRNRALPRKEKKGKKRDLVRGAYSLTFGIGIGVANLHYPPSFLISCSAAFMAIHQAGRDIMGDPE